MQNYETIIGIEIHVELNTKRKIFSPAINDINAAPNTNVHPIDLALPGTMPRFNEEVLRKALMITKGFSMEVTKEMHWDRKNYFYHDNPKGFQITQFETPIGRNGYITLSTGKNIGISFMHMEEDTAKSIHQNDVTLLDFNRCGVPLVEIVSEPDIRSGAEAREYVEKLREVLLYLDASDCKMNEGSLRVDVNVSVRPYGQTEFNPKVEIKNLNSLANVELSIEKEVANQIKAYSTNQPVVQATKRFNEATKNLDIMRVKEGSVDYRYMPEPDLPWLKLTEEYISDTVSNMPLLPSQIKTKLEEIGVLTDKEVKSLMTNREMTLFYLSGVEAGIDAKQLINYLLVNTNEVMNAKQLEFSQLTITIDDFKELTEFLEAGKISTNHVKQILPLLLTTTDSVATIVKKLGIEQLSDPSQILTIINEVFAQNEQSIVDYKAGKDRAFGFLIGQVMKASKGQANPKLVNELVKKELDSK